MNAARFPQGVALAVLLLVGCTRPALPPLPSGDPPGTHLARAHAAFAGRIRAVATREAIEHLEAALAVTPDDAEAHVWLARAFHWLGQAHLESDAEREVAWSEGRRHGELALELAPESVGARYWTATNLAHLASISPPYQQAFLFKRMRPLHREVLERDETYHHGGSHVFFGLFHAHAPAMMGGDRRSAYAAFDRALEIAPDYMPWVVLFCERLLLDDTDKAGDDREHDRARALVLIDDALGKSAAILPGAIAENELAQAALRGLRGAHF